MEPSEALGMIDEALAGAVVRGEGVELVLRAGLLLAFGDGDAVAVLRSASADREVALQRVGASPSADPFLRGTPWLLGEGEQAHEAIRRFMDTGYAEPELASVTLIDLSRGAHLLANLYDAITCEDASTLCGPERLPALVDLDLSQHEEIALPMIEALFGRLPVPKLRLRRLALTAAEWGKVAAMPGFANVEALDLSGCDFEGGVVQTLMKAAPRLHTLRLAHLPKLLDAEELANRSFEYLDLRGTAVQGSLPSVAQLVEDR